MIPKKVILAHALIALAILTGAFFLRDQSAWLLAAYVGVGIVVALCVANVTILRAVLSSRDRLEKASRRVVDDVRKDQAKIRTDLDAVREGQAKSAADTQKVVNTAVRKVTENVAIQSLDANNHIQHIGKEVRDLTALTSELVARTDVEQAR